MIILGTQKLKAKGSLVQCISVLDRELAIQSGVAADASREWHGSACAVSQLVCRGRGFVPRAVLIDLRGRKRTSMQWTSVVGITPPQIVDMGAVY